MDARKETWKRQLLELRLFRVVRDLIEYHEGELKKDELVHELAVRLPMENLEQTFGTLVAWGRFGELFAYREDRGVLTPE
jgi:NitT/TauT family transport system ATP-binding protein